MIEVRYLKTDRGFEEFHLEGHAEYGELGKDIVCAGVSTLAYTLLASLESIPITPKFVRMEKGNMDLELHVYPHPIRNHIDTIFNTVLIGLKQIESKYPENVKIYKDIDVNIL